MKKKLEVGHVALRLKEAVWKKYKVNEQPEENRGLLWVLDPTLPPTPTKSKADLPITLNLFSVSLHAQFIKYICVYDVLLRSVLSFICTI